MASTTTPRMSSLRSQAIMAPESAPETTAAYSSTPGMVMVDTCGSTVVVMVSITADMKLPEPSATADMQRVSGSIGAFRSRVRTSRMILASRMRL